MHYFKACVFILLTIIFIGVLSEGCLQAAGGDIFTDLFDNQQQSSNILLERNQVIVASYRFQCCGNITEWMFRFRSAQRDIYAIRFQVWRPSLTVQTDGCYSLVGENRIQGESLSSRRDLSYNPDVAERIMFQPDDVVGFYITSQSVSVRHGISLSTNNIEESVWYGSTDGVIESEATPECPFPVGTQSDRILRNLTNAAPVISAAVTTIQCPSTLSTRISPVTSTMAAITQEFLPQQTLSSPVPTKIPTPRQPVTSSSLQTKPLSAETIITADNNIDGLNAGLVIIVFFLLMFGTVALVSAGVIIRVNSDRKHAVKSQVLEQLEENTEQQSDTNANKSTTARHVESVYYSQISQEPENSLDVSIKTNIAYVATDFNIPTTRNEAYCATTINTPQDSAVQNGAHSTTVTAEVYEIPVTQNEAYTRPTLQQSESQSPNEEEQPYYSHIDGEQNTWTSTTIGLEAKITKGTDSKATASTGGIRLQNVATKPNGESDDQSTDENPYYSQISDDSEDESDITTRTNRAYNTTDFNIQTRSNEASNTTTTEQPYYSHIHGCDENKAVLYEIPIEAQGSDAQGTHGISTKTNAAYNANTTNTSVNNSPQEEEYSYCKLVASYEIPANGTTSES